MSKRESEDLITWLDPCRRTRGKPDPHTARGQAVLPLRTLMRLMLTDDLTSVTPLP